MTIEKENLAASAGTASSAATAGMVRGAQECRGKAIAMLHQILTSQVTRTLQKTDTAATAGIKITTEKERMTTIEIEVTTIQQMGNRIVLFLRIRHVRLLGLLFLLARIPKNTMVPVHLHSLLNQMLHHRHRHQGRIGIFYRIHTRPSGFHFRRSLLRL